MSRNMDFDFMSKAMPFWSAYQSYRKAGLTTDLIYPIQSIADVFGVELKADTVKAAIGIALGDVETAVSGIENLDQAQLNNVPRVIKDALIRKLGGKTTLE